MTTNLDILKQIAISKGYRIEREETETHIIEKLIRPDGTVAVTAKRPK